MLALLPAILALAPSLAEWLGGPKASAVAAQAVSVVQAVTGSTDPEVIANLSPDKRAELQIRLAEIAVEQRKAEFSDLANARAMINNPMIAKAQITFAAGILLLFAAILLLMLIRGAPTDQSGLFYYAMGILSAGVGVVMTFFFSGNTSAHAANNALANLAQRQPMVAPAAPIINQPSGTVVTGASTDDLNDASLRAARG